MMRKTKLKNNQLKYFNTQVKSFFLLKSDNLSVFVDNVNENLKLFRICIINEYICDMFWGL
jgi:hypothetical protein